MTADRFDVAIVGAGFAGAATAWHLARRGVRDLVVLEREAVAGTHSSGRNAALVRERVDLPLWQRLTTEGAAAIRTGERAEFRRNGSILLGLGDDDVGRRFPLARGRGLWCPDDGIVDVAALLASYLAGAEVRYGTAVEGWRRDGDGLLVRTSGGELRTRILVNAAGAWAGRLGGLPLTPMNRTLFVSEETPAIAPDWPFVWDVHNGLYFRPESGGLLLSACDERAAAPGDYAEEPDLVETLAQRVRERQPDLGDLRIAYRWVGQRTFTSDRVPAIGFDAREPRLFHVAGLGGHGVTGSHAIGALAADLLLGTARGPNPYDPARLEAASAVASPLAG